MSHNNNEYFPLLSKFPLNIQLLYISLSAAILCMSQSFEVSAHPSRILHICFLLHLFCYYSIVTNVISLTTTSSNVNVINIDVKKHYDLNE